MTLVEGHGDYVMDAVGPQVVPSVEQIRERFNSRRGSQGRIEQAIRRVLGIDLKMKQYAEGSRFVKAVVDEVGMAGLQQGLDLAGDPADQGEFTDPHLWVERVVSPARAASSPVSLTPPVPSTPPPSPDPTIPGSVTSGPAPRDLLTQAPCSPVPHTRDPAPQRREPRTGHARAQRLGNQRLGAQRRGTGGPGSTAPASMGPGVAVAEVRTAVRSCLSDLGAGSLALVACSGGADSLALAAAAAFVAPRLGLRAGGVTVDHGLQDGSDERAAAVSARLTDSGLTRCAAWR